MSIYDLTVKDMQGNIVNMADYKGKVLLIVNTATGCGFTPQYDGLEDLYKEYKEKGLEILDFPCNQFGNQAPGNESEIASFCKARFGITFKQFAKSNVNGDDENPVYTFLKAEKGGTIKWNFTKFLVNRNGEVVSRYAPTKKPKSLARDIEKLL